MRIPRAIAALLCIAAATALAPIIGGAATATSVSTWYPTLNKPDWTPPPWVFGPVWTALYAMMAVAAWLVWLRLSRRAGAAMLTRKMTLPATLYTAQLALNALWSILFFGLQQPGVAAVELWFLWVLIAATCIVFWRISPWAGALFVPYLAWVTFAGALNVAIWRLN